MITNERQYKITRSQFLKLESALTDQRDRLNALESKPNLLEQAQLDAMGSECEVLAEQIRAYEELRSGAVTMFKADSLEELPDLLIRARISQGLSQKEMADRLGLKEQQIQRYESESYRSASLRRLVDVANALNLSVSEIGELHSTSVAPASAQEFDGNRFPIGQMYKRGYFDDFSGSLNAAKNAATELVSNLANEAGRPMSSALLRQSVRADSTVDRFALLAWQWRVLWKAKNQPNIGSYDRRLLTSDWMLKVAKLSALDDGPRVAQNLLAEFGIALVIEPHLPGTHLDGAAFLGHEERPIIGLTLRYDRLDNFWFALLHEIAHVARHLSSGEVDQIFDDLDATADAIEREADELAGEALIPSDVWEVALARYLQTDSAVSALAADLGIGVAVIAGRIRHESKNYTLLSELLGQGEVRKQFSDVRFG